MKGGAVVGGVVVVCVCGGGGGGGGGQGGVKDPAAGAAVGLAEARGAGRGEGEQRTSGIDGPGGGGSSGGCSRAGSTLCDRVLLLWQASRCCHVPTRPQAAMTAAAPLLRPALPPLAPARPRPRPSPPLSSPPQGACTGSSSAVQSNTRGRGTDGGSRASGCWLTGKRDGNPGGARALHRCCLHWWITCRAEHGRGARTEPGSWAGSRLAGRQGAGGSRSTHTMQRAAVVAFCRACRNWLQRPRSLLQRWRRPHNNTPP